eukprot:CAMPEP_0179180266 /NCGR_PEP_ID=MMETSP0796-20121207/89238_1 /TAXON_ID=73915 /ORGANISM="Pyrodinium bahamense, Strain pbaha01" /LENGTH=59 /DNA_ID=CAMNT_0020883965 /DNA_START=450 /DNA_END=629 /DNA_ORIENTATION=+
MRQGPRRKDPTVPSATTPDTNRSSSAGSNWPSLPTACSRRPSSSPWELEAAIEAAELQS